MMNDSQPGENRQAQEKMEQQEPLLLSELANPDLMMIHDEGSADKSFGCKQDWFGQHWQRQAGCGPCTAATLIYYLSRRQPELGPLYTAASHTKTDFTHFMEEIWYYVTPGYMGVNEASILADGVHLYAESHGIELTPIVQKIPGNQQSSRPSASEFTSFIKQGLDQDCPVAFLNLSNGQLDNLDSWHWVSITGLQADPNGEIFATIADNGECKQINLTLWHCTTLLGGAVVYFTAGN
jgi:hypothetical protein